MLDHLHLGATTTVAAAAAAGVHRTTLYRWKKQQERIVHANQVAPSKCYLDPKTRAPLAVRHPQLEKR